jgi:hypothetical protein
MKIVHAQIGPQRFSVTMLERAAASRQAGIMQTAEIIAGAPVVITDAFGDEIPTIALSGIEVSGHSFPVVWVERPLKNGDTEPAPWPLDAVKSKGAD